MQAYRTAVWSVVAVSVLSGLGRAQAPEAIKYGAERAWANSTLSMPKLERKAAQQPSAPSPEQPPRKLFHQPELQPIEPNALGPLLGSFRLADRLDYHRTLIARQLGKLVWDISMASDPTFEVPYLSFFCSPVLLLRRIDDLNRLRGEGIVVQLDELTQYRVRVSINIFSPVRGSTVHLEPVYGTRGPSHKLKTGEVLDAAKARMYVFRADGKEFWLAYGTDVDPRTNQLADTRSLLFIHEAGLDSKAWPLAEGRLETDRPLGVNLGGTLLSLVRTADGMLRIHGR